ncbi:hypothetical protein IJH97_00055 [Candidatus Saccharibacteria bacterium]|nr:hypothetical protein [Candidatus Saccharibacteria bacterium]
MNTNIITICVFALLGLIAPALGLLIDMKDEEEKLNIVEALLSGLPVAIVSGLVAWLGNIWLILAIAVVLFGMCLFPSLLFEKSRRGMLGLTTLVFLGLLAVLYFGNPLDFNVKDQVAEAEPIETVQAATPAKTEEAIEIATEVSAEEATEEPEEINLSGQKSGASISTVSVDEVEKALTVDLNKIALFGNSYEKYSRIFSDFGEECMPTQANWDRKHEDLKYALDKKFIKNTWQDAPCFMPVYVKDALTADGVKGLDTLAKFLNEHHKEDMKEDVIKQIKCNPVYGMMWADGMSQLELTTGKTLGDLNEWMTRAIDRNEEFRQVPYGQHPRGNEGWLEAYIDEAGNKKIRTTDEYDEFATKMLILIFDCFSDEIGIDRYQSKIMYGLEPNMDGDLIQCERLEKGEDYPGLMLKYDRKDADREILLKVNIWDLRLEICDRKQKSVAQIQAEKPKKKVTPKPVAPVQVAPVQVAPITPVTVNPVTGVPVWSTPSGGGGDHPDHPDNPNPPSTPEKDPSQDPGPRDNAPDGSGPNDDPGPGVYQPDEPKWEAPKVTEPEHHEEHHDEPKQEDHHDEEVHRDENKPDDSPTPVHEDSHDHHDSGDGGNHSSSGDHNGSFSMPD